MNNSRVLVIVCGILIMLWALTKTYSIGWNNGNMKALQQCDTVLEKVKKEHELVIKHNVEVKDKIVEKIVYKDRVIKEKGDVIEKEIIKYVPSGCSALDAEWVRIHNKAASGL